MPTKKPDQLADRAFLMRKNRLAEVVPQAGAGVARPLVE